MQEMLLRDEKEWQTEFADIPSQNSTTDEPPKILSTEKESHIFLKPSNRVNYSEFSGILQDDNDDTDQSTSSMSIGRYFADRCVDIRELIPNRSPTKLHAVALLSNSHRSGNFCFYFIFLSKQTFHA